MRLLVAAVMAGLVAAPGCGVGADGGSPVTVTVLAAASLTDAFTELGEVFIGAHPEVDLRFDFGPSSGLANRIVEGSPGDLFVSADPAAIDQVVAAGAAASAAEVVATNTMMIAVPAGNPGSVRGVADLARSELLVGLCAEEVPCGKIARRLLAQAGVAAAVDTNELDVRSLLTKIEAGELDAGVVYRSDVRAAADQVDGIAVPGAEETAATYPAVVLAGASAPDEAEAFLAYVRSSEGQAILVDHGFRRG